MLRSFLGAEQDNLAWVHFTPACGTASRAHVRTNPADLVQDIGVYDVNVDSCCHGGVRKDSTKYGAQCKAGASTTG